MPYDFEDIRPYTDAEMREAMKRIVADRHFPLVAGFVYPDRNPKEVVDMFLSFEHVLAFQYKVMYDLVIGILAKSIDRFTWEGIENLDRTKNYLFVSNHRDIFLDATLLQYILYQEGFPTTEISFGSNLMQGQFVTDIGKSNRMYKTVRGGSPRELLKNSMLLSAYLRHCITEKGVSSWIAQRNGRTKNGIDATDPGIIKMFNMSGRNDVLSNIAELNIVPVAVSYQYETCDAMKARELFLSQTEAYRKAPGEDMKSILAGINDDKGSLHFAIAKPVTREDLAPFEALDKNSLFPAIASLIDRRIGAGYRLWDTHYIGYDLLYGGDNHATHYSGQQKQAFIDRMEKVLASLDVHDEGVRKTFLQIYANPVNAPATYPQSPAPQA